MTTTIQNLDDLQDRRIMMDRYLLLDSFLVMIESL